MTPGESVELLFRCRTEGGAAIDTLAGSVRGVSAASVLASADVSTLEKSIQALTGAVTANTAAHSGLARGTDQTTAALTRMTGGARTASNELRVLEGAMPIRAAAQFLTQMKGVSLVMNAAFPLFGFIALVGVLDMILDKTGLLPSKWDAVTEAQKESYKEMDKQSKKYDELLGKLQKLRLEEYERLHGKEARQLLEAGEQQGRAGGVDHAEVERLRQQVEALRKFANPWTKDSSGFTQAVVPNEQEAFLLNMAGVGKTGLWGMENSQAQPGVFSDAMSRRAKELLPEYESRLRTASVNQEVDVAESSDTRAKLSAEQRKTADEEAKKRKQEIAELEKQAAAYLREAQNFELTGLDRINAVYREKLELLGKTKKAIDDINAGYAIEVQREIAREVEKGAGQMDKLHDWWMGHGTPDPSTGGFLMDVKAPKTLRGGYAESQQRNDEEYVKYGLKTLQDSDDSDASAVRRSLGVTVHGNSTAVAGGRMTGQSAAVADYMARASAAREIFQIETQHLGLIAEQDKRDEAYANARKKRDEEIYHAAEQYEIQLQTLREKDLQKYHELAGSIFDAMHGHTMNQWFRGFAVNQAKQVFENAATPILQSAGHMLGSVTGGFNPGGLLTGTVLDPANKGASDASTTAKETKRTADEVYALRGDVRAMSGAPAPTAGDTGGGGAGIFNLPMSHNPLGNPLAVFGSDIGGWTGSGSGLGVGSAGTSALFNAGGGSGLGQFFSGLGGGGSNPLGAIFGGMSTNGGTVTQLTGAQQAGVAVGTAAMLAGAGLSIASGISQGGVGGYTKAASAGMGAAAMLDPEPISKTILASAAAITGLVGAVFGTGPQQRSKDIFNALSSNQYLAPTALNVIQGMNGTYEDFDARGNLRTSTMSAVPTVAEPYITSRVVDGSRTYYDVNGNVTSPYSGGATGTGQAPVAGGVTINVGGNLQAMDSESFHEFVRRPANSHSVGEATADHLERHDGRLANAVRFIAG